MNQSKILLSALCASVSLSLFAQNTTPINALGVAESDRLNTITTAVPFLIITPDSRAGAMGDVGVATAPDVNSVYWNPSKLVRSEKNMGFAVSHSPWLRQLVPDISLSYLSGYGKIGDYTAVGGSFRYFSLGDIVFTNELGQEIYPFRPNEFSLDGFVATRLSDYLSGSVGFRFVNSNLTGGVPVQGAETKPGRTVAADISAYYENTDFKIGDKDATLAAGVMISNIGGKIAYSNTSRSDFIPINLRIGPRLTVELDDYNTISIAADFNKLLVPTPPIYKRDSTGALLVDANNNLVIGAGDDPDKAVASGIFGSFADAPGSPLLGTDGDFLTNPDGTYQVDNGSVFREELNEVNIGIGMEYWYDKQFAVRAGYFYEHRNKGNRKFFSVGAGLHYNVFGLDLAYLIPAYFGSTFQTSPLQNTLRFTLTFDFDAFKQQNAQPKTDS